MEIFKENALEVLSGVAQAIYDKKGFNILALDVREISTLTDYFIIAEGNVDRHVKAIAQEVVDHLKKKGAAPMHAEGMEASEWLVLDYGELVIHLFVPSLREKYRLEELWHDAEIIDLNIEVHPEE